MEAISKDDAISLINKARDDPAWWVRNVLGHQPWQKQIEILESVRDNPETAVKSCHAAGKSFIAADAVLWFLYTHRPSIVITTAPTDRQVRKILWKEIRTSFQSAIKPLGGEILSQELKLDENWFAWGFTAREYDASRFQGFHEIYILVVVDEAAGVTEDIYSGVDGVLTSDESRLLMIGNPTNPSGRFAKAFGNPRVSKISVPSFITPNFETFGITKEDIIANTFEEKITGPLPAPHLVTPRWVRKAYEDWGIDNPFWTAKVEANFPQVGEDALIPAHLIDAAVDRQLPATGQNELAVDVARYGSDETVIMHRMGQAAKTITVLPMSSTMQTAGHVILAIKNTGAKLTKIDTVGVGAGVFDRLEEQKVAVAEMQSGAAPKEPDRFINARAEWWWNLRTLFERGEISIENDEVLKAQLAAMRYTVNSRGKVQIESKDDMKKRGLRSPDRADTLMLLFGIPHRLPITGKRFPLGGATRS